MKISQLAERSGVPVSSIKFYLREGLLPAGLRSAPNQARTSAKSAAWLAISSMRPLTSAAGGGHMIRLMAPAAEDLRPTIEERLEFETLIADLLARFVSVSAHQLDAAILETLRRLGEFLDADRGAVFLLDGAHRTLILSHFWSRTGAAPVSQTLDAALLMPYGLNKLLNADGSASGEAPFVAKVKSALGN